MHTVHSMCITFVHPAIALAGPHSKSLLKAARTIVMVEDLLHRGTALVLALAVDCHQDAAARR